MISIQIEEIRYPYQIKLLSRAIEGDVQAQKNMLNHLSSTNLCLCQMIQETIHELQDTKVWWYLLNIFALHQWIDLLEYDPYTNSKIINRIDQAIIDAFTHDENECEITLKEFVLNQAMDNPEPKLRRAAAYLSGLRGNLDAIPILGEIIVECSKFWQLRAIKALSVLNDERCIPPLIEALTGNRDLIHREARRALQNLGPKPETAWLELLDHPDGHIRWEAAWGLSEIGDARAALTLAEGLLDESYAVRWATAEALSDLGLQGVLAALRVLSHYPLDESSRRSAYHALHGISSRIIKDRIKLLIEALRDPNALTQVPLIAQNLLIELE